MNEAMQNQRFIGDIINVKFFVKLGAAGFWVSVNRILTKSLVNDERGNTSMFFSLSIMTIVMCSVLHWIVRKTEFVQFYVNLCQERNRIILEPTEDVGLVRLLLFKRLL